MCRTRLVQIAVIGPLTIGVDILRPPYLHLTVPVPAIDLPITKRTLLDEFLSRVQSSILGRRLIPAEPGSRRRWIECAERDLCCSGEIENTFIQIGTPSGKRNIGDEHACGVWDLFAS